MCVCVCVRVSRCVLVYIYTYTHTQPTYLPTYIHTCIHKTRTATHLGDEGMKGIAWTRRAPILQSIKSTKVSQSIQVNAWSRSNATADKQKQGNGWCLTWTRRTRIAMIARFVTTRPRCHGRRGPQPLRFLRSKASARSTSGSIRTLHVRSGKVSGKVAGARCLVVFNATSLACSRALQSCVCVCACVCVCVCVCVCAGMQPQAQGTSSVSTNSDSSRMQVMRRIGGGRSALDGCLNALNSALRPHGRGIAVGGRARSRQWNHLRG